MNANLENPDSIDRADGGPVYFGLLAAISMIVLGAFVYKPGIDGYAHAMFGDMVYGDAAKPYVCRALAPAAVRILTSLIPDDARSDWAQAMAETPAGDNLLKILNWNAQYFVEYLIALALMYLCLLGFAWVLRKLLNEIYFVSSRTAGATVLIALAALIPQFRYYSYLYDFPALFLFTYGLLLLHARRWRMFMFIFFAATLNKETSILLTMAFAIHFFKPERLSRGRYFLLGAAQIAVFLTIKGALAYIYRDNPGALVELHWKDHNLEMLQESHPGMLLLWGGFVLLLFARWKEKPAFLRNAVWILAPLILLTAAFGYLDELRDYYEAYPVVVLLTLHSVGRVVGFDVVPKHVDYEPASSNR